jgi:hypothetical protein
MAPANPIFGGADLVAVCAPLPVTFDWQGGRLRPVGRVTWTWEEPDEVELTHVLLYNDLGDVFARLALNNRPIRIRCGDTLELSDIVLDLNFGGVG